MTSIFLFVNYMLNYRKKYLNWAKYHNDNLSRIKEIHHRIGVIISHGVLTFSSGADEE